MLKRKTKLGKGIRTMNMGSGWGYNFRWSG